MRDAIALNEARAPLYGALSGGRSLAISRRLVRSERALLPVARWFDWRARRWERAGIPILEEIFVPMATAPAFTERGTEVRSTGDSANVSTVRHAALRRFRDAGFEGAGTVLGKAIDALGAQPGADCLVRHLLESAHRLTILAPMHVCRAREKGLPSPARLLALLLRLHLWGLASARDLDDRARPLQARGIPILANDLPPIPRDGEIVAIAR